MGAGIDEFGVGKEDTTRGAGNSRRIRMTHIVILSIGERGSMSGPGSIDGSERGATDQTGGLTGGNMGLGGLD